MATLRQTQISVEEYIARYIMRNEKPACEYVDGMLIPKSMGTPEHATVQANLAYSLKLHCRQNFKTMTELSVETRAQRHYRIPDVALMDRTRPIQGHYPGPDNPCFLCIEVLSPPDSRKKLFKKCREEYHTWGVPYCWVIDPVKRRAWEYFPGDPEPREVFGQISAGPVTLQFNDIFEDVSV